MKGLRRRQQEDGDEDGDAIDEGQRHDRGEHDDDGEGACGGRAGRLALIR